MAFICSECGAREYRKEAAFCGQCGGLLVPASGFEHCDACAHDNLPDKKFCVRCGRPLYIECAECSVKCSSTDSFCGKCGCALPGRTEHAVSGAASPAENIACAPEEHIQSTYTNCRVGEHFLYGSYPQGKNGEVKPIEWRVLARDQDKLLVIALYGLDCKRYNEKLVDTNWSQCSLRSWLNGEFMDKAFTLAEQRNLMRLTLATPKGPGYLFRASGGPDTCDKVFLLSMDNAKRYFSRDDERCCKATAYAVERGAFVSDNVEYAGNCYWWLRSPGYYADDVAYAGSYGLLNYRGVSDDRGAVRPAVFMAF